MTFEEFTRLVDEHRSGEQRGIIIPVHKRLSADLLTPVSAFLSIRSGSRYSFLLESVEGGEKLGRYSFLGKNPFKIVRAFGSDVTIEYAGMQAEKGRGDIFEVLQQELDRYVEVKVSGLPRFTSGAVGYIGYDTVRLIERLPDQPADDLNLPDAVWCFYDTFAAFDHVKHQLVLMSGAFIDADADPSEAYTKAMTRIDALASELSNTFIQSPEAVRILDDRMSSNFQRQDFENAVEKTRRYIYEGDIFQAVISQRFP